jgi:hypothetical protein
MKFGLAPVLRTDAAEIAVEHMLLAVLGKRDVQKHFRIIRS